MKPFAICHVPFAIVILIAGCSAPSKPNIELRKTNAELREKVDVLQKQHDADMATIKSLESRATTVPILPQERTAQLFTVQGLQFGRLTGLDPDKSDALKVYVVPTDGEGEPIKAAGSFTVDAFDLAAGGDNRIGHWEFGVDQAAKNWFGKAMLYTYVLPCPLSQKPAHDQVTLKVTFTDALTQRTFDAQKVVTLRK